MSWENCKQKTKTKQTKYISQVNLFEIVIPTNKICVLLSNLTISQEIVNIHATCKNISNSRRQVEHSKTLFILSAILNLIEDIKYVLEAINIYCSFVVSNCFYTYAGRFWWSSL